MSSDTRLLLDLYDSGKNGLPLSKCLRQDLDKLVRVRLADKMILPNPTYGEDRAYLTPAGRETGRMIREAGDSNE